MKNVIFVIPKMECGGVEKALINMLKKLKDENDYNIDLLILSEKNEFEENIPKGINVYRRILSNIYNKKKLLFDYIKKLKFYSALKVIYDIILCRINERIFFSYKLKNIEEFEKKYDIAISYHSSWSISVVYTISNIKADKKILWIHNDPMSNEKVTDMFKCIYEKYDRIYCVSQEIKEKIANKYLCLKDKLMTFENIIDKEEIIEKSKLKESFNDNYNGIKILTIGRISYEKGYELAIESFKKILKDSYDAKWYVIGEGPEKQKIIELIKKENLENQFILLGQKQNPYGYLKDCDIYVQPSLDEGYCIATKEAKVLAKPIVRTRTAGANDQFVDGYNAILVNISAEDIYLGIKKYINNPNIKNDIIQNLLNENKKEENELNIKGIFDF